MCLFYIYIYAYTCAPLSRYSLSLLALYWLPKLQVAKVLPENSSFWIKRPENSWKSRANPPINGGLKCGALGLKGDRFMGTFEQGGLVRIRSSKMQWTPYSSLPGCQVGAFKPATSQNQRGGQLWCRTDISLQSADDLGQARLYSLEARLADEMDARSGSQTVPMWAVTCRDWFGKVVRPRIAFESKVLLDSCAVSIWWEPKSGTHGRFREVCKVLDG